MKKIIIFGNSGSGKSTLAKHLSNRDNLNHLDLDSLAWQAASPPQRKSLQESALDIQVFLEQSDSWVIEGCYSDLLELAIPMANEITFLNLPVELNIENAKKRPWEPHKYDSKEDQDTNLPMLIEWIKAYDLRNDTFSRKTHLKLFEQFAGKKNLVTENLDLEKLAMIRTAKAKDAKFIADIYNYYIDNSIITFETNHVSNQDMIKRIKETFSQKLPYLVFEEGDKVIGYTYASKWKGRCAYRYTVEVTVYLDHQVTGKSYGTQLYKELFKQLKALGYHSVIGGISLPNPASIALHEKMGMERVAHFKETGFKFDRWVDVGYWQKIL